MVQAVFIGRIWKLSNQNKTLVIVISIASAAQFVFHMVYSGFGFHTSDNSETLINISRGINAASTVADCLIGGSLVWFLKKCQVGIQRSDSIVNALIIFFMTTGLATAVSAIVTLSLTLAYPQSLYSVIFYLNITRLYVNTLLAMLNFRTKLGPALANGVDQAGDWSQMNPLPTQSVQIGTVSFLHLDEPQWSEYSYHRHWRRNRDK
ncbi:uncharacterized protein FOMMEDRAFT_128769 [Fomitiporia mediterranea MF3/22]|uniref:uncharacterized protein n=1 Tax=Fomitiporia mediterranea (strain MF3/22) TaxID=694068 RepID=UPI000440851C|nr:uncharacterized protein FOMMEDRAFT_128769 [Fomitiporia mediterranea MF3/22]EJC99055.1 hypothetical protein FOMMEDRAFT_128769 [Fomitiporia mediterranea MF3/22]